MDNSSPTHHPPVTVQRAASVLLLRETTGGLEVFIQHRAMTMDFAAGVIVYPGGRVDQQDTAASGEVSDVVAAEHARRWARTSLGELGPEQARFASAVVAAAARREVREETGAELHTAQLHPWANWVTPVGNPKRFDTYFYVAALEPGQRPRHQTTEATDSQWIRPEELFRACDAGKVRLMAPTRATLQAVTRHSGLDEVLAQQAEIVPVRPLRPSSPAAGQRIS